MHLSSGLSGKKTCVSVGVTITHVDMHGDVIVCTLTHGDVIVCTLTHVDMHRDVIVCTDWDSLTVVCTAPQ